MLLNESFSSQKIFREIYTVYRSAGDCHTKLRGRGASIAVSEAVSGPKLTSDFEYFQECVWVEITVTDGRNLLTDNYYFTPHIKADIIKNYLNFLVNRLDTLNYRVILFGHFNAPGFYSNCGLRSPNCYFYTKLKGDLNHSATCFLGLNQYNFPDTGSNLLDIVYSLFQILLIFQLVMLNSV
jgi:hypothetical protein